AQRQRSSSGLRGKRIEGKTVQDPIGHEDESRDAARELGERRLEKGMVEPSRARRLRSVPPVEETQVHTDGRKELFAVRNRKRGDVVASDHPDPRAVVDGPSIQIKVQSRGHLKAKERLVIGHCVLYLVECGQGWAADRAEDRVGSPDLTA